MRGGSGLLQDEDPNWKNEEFGRTLSSLEAESVPQELRRAQHKARRAAAVGHLVGRHVAELGQVIGG